MYTQVGLYATNCLSLSSYCGLVFLSRKMIYVLISRLIRGTFPKTYCHQKPLPFHQECDQAPGHGTQSVRWGRGTAQPSVASRSTLKCMEPSSWEPHPCRALVTKTEHFHSAASKATCELLLSEPRTGASGFELVCVKEREIWRHPSNNHWSLLWLEKGLAVSELGINRLCQGVRLENQR